MLYLKGVGDRFIVFHSAIYNAYEIIYGHLTSYRREINEEERLTCFLNDLMYTAVFSTYLLITASCIAAKKDCFKVHKQVVFVCAVTIPTLFAASQIRYQFWRLLLMFSAAMCLSTMLYKGLRTLHFPSTVSHKNIVIINLLNCYHIEVIIA